MEGKFVLLTTEHRGVFFGRLDRYDESARVAELSNARMVVHWPAECHGVLGLASDGPRKGCRISPAVPELRLTGVTAVGLVAESALPAWERDWWLG